MGLLWVLLIGVAIYFFLNMDKSHYRGPGGELETPMEILKRRYARGEITHEQFDEMKQHLQ